MARYAAAIFEIPDGPTNDEAWDAISAALPEDTSTFTAVYLTAVLDDAAILGSDVTDAVEDKDWQ